MNREFYSLLPASSAPFKGWVFYDGQCGLCLGLLRRFKELLEKVGFELVPLQESWVQEKLNFPTALTIPDEMQVLTPQNTLLGGADACIYITQFFYVTLPLYWLAQVPGVKSLLRLGYRWLAKNRYCAFPLS